MPEVSFTPTFRHVDWVDNVDRVMAGGPNGFNVRFDTIDHDLHQVSTVVGQIDGVLGDPVPQLGEIRFTPPLDLVSDTTATGGWLSDANGVAHPSPGAGGTAAMPLTLPESVRLLSFRAVGLFPGGSTRLSIRLLRTSLLNPAQASDELAVITGDLPGITNPFDVTVAVNANFAAVNPNAFRYCVQASATSVADSSATAIATVQLVFTGT